MNRVIAIPALIAALCATPLSAAEARTADPAAGRNVVLILIDDLGWKYLGCYGSSYYRTPAIDRLAREGVPFTDAYAACAVCTPTRAAILTGKYPARMLMTNWTPDGRWNPKSPLREARFLRALPLEEITLAEALREAGYRTASIGKWHLGGPPFSLPEHHGFDLNIGGNAHGAPGDYIHPYRGDWPIPTTGLRANWNVFPDGPPGEYLTDRLTDEAVKYIRDSRQRPFFLYLSHYAVHTPLQAKPEKVAQYAQVPEAERQGDPVYAAMIESVDDSVARVLATLEELGLKDRTVVIFTSDNGGFWRATNHAPLRGHKGTYWEGGIRVPLIIRWPGVSRAGRVVSEPVISSDLYPTILAAAGQPPRPSQHLDGLNLAPLLREADTLARQEAKGQENTQRMKPRFLMKPHPILAAASAIPLAMLLAAAAPQPAGKPNVLFIAIDDLRTALGSYGDPLAKSPNIDRLARSSRLFNRAYSQQAVCGPSRASLLTGKLPANIGVWHNRNLFRDTVPDVVTLPQLFRNHGYHAASMGKVFSGREREEDPRSWSVPAILRRPGWRNYALPDSGRSEGKAAAFEAADVPDDGYPDGKLADLAVATLEQFKAGNRPFFLAVGFFKPHLPFNAPKKYWDRYDPAFFKLESATARVKGAPDLAYHGHRELGGYRDIPEDERVAAEQARTLRHGYYACVSYVDAQVGKLLGTLDRLGLEHNTIVVLWGDHGFALGEGSRWCKGTNFELDTRVPLMIRTPGLTQPGAASEALVELVDVYPTLAELAGLTPPADLDGRSLVPILEDPRARGRDLVFSQFARPFRPSPPEFMGYSIRSDTHRYTRWIEWPTRKILAEELYDYASPASVTRTGSFLVEQENLAEQPAYAELRGRLGAKLDEVLSLRTHLRTDETPATGPARPRKNQ